MGSRLFPTPGPIDLTYGSYMTSYQGLSMCQIWSRSIEKWQRNRWRKSAVEENKKERIIKIRNRSKRERSSNVVGRPYRYIDVAGVHSDIA